MVISKKDELVFCAPIKTVMMLLVVLYHSCALWMGGWFGEPATPSEVIGVFARWLNTFHVPTFVFLSGCLYAFLKTETDKYGKASAVIKKKVKRLLVPYIFVCAVWAIPFWVFYFGPDKVVSKYMLAGGPSQLWFLVMLFVLFILFELLWKIVGERIVCFSVPALLGMLVLFCLGCVAGKAMPINMFQLSSALQYALIFWLGMAFRLHSNEGFWRVPSFLLVALHLAIFTAVQIVGTMNGPLWSCASIALWPVVRVAGIAMAISCLGRALSRFGYDKKKLPLGGVLLEENSLGAYLFHQQIIWVVISCLNVPGVPPLALVLANFSISLAVSLAISVLFGCFKVTRFLTGR